MRGLEGQPGKLFSPEQIPGGGSGGGRGPISGPFSSWAAALTFVRSHSPAMTTAFSNPHAPFERDPVRVPGFSSGLRWVWKPARMGRKL